MFGDDAERVDFAAVVDVERFLDLRRGHPEVMLIVSVDREDLSGVVREADRLRDLSENSSLTFAKRWLPSITRC